MFKVRLRWERSGVRIEHKLYDAREGIGRKFHQGSWLLSLVDQGSSRRPGMECSAMVHLAMICAAWVISTYVQFVLFGVQLFSRLFLLQNDDKVGTTVS